MGLIGAGRIGRIHAENISTYLRDRATIKAVADPRAEKISGWVRALGIEQLYRDPQYVLDDKGIDAVLICSSTDTHCPLIIDSASSGKHIFCEKPIDLEVPRIRKALRAVGQAGVKLQIGFQRRFDPHFSEIKKMIGAGKIGEPQIIKITSRDPEPPPPDYIAVSGGIFLDMTIHDFDMARFLLNSEVEEVYAGAAVLIDSAIGEAGDVDTALVTLKFQSGALGVIDNSRKAVYGYDQRVEVFGSQGAVTAGNEAPVNVEYSCGEGVIRPKPKYFFTERYREAYIKEIEAFIHSVGGDSEPPVGGEDGLKAVLIGAAAKESLASGKPVRVEGQEGCR